MAQIPPQIVTDTIPLGGNAWVKEPAEITEAGLTKWTSTASVTEIYFRTDKAQPFQLSLRLRVPHGKSVISLIASGAQISKQVSNVDFRIINFGKLSVTEAGYVRLILKGISKTGTVYAEVTDLLVQRPAPRNKLIYVKRGSSFYFGRRGPSVHLRYTVPDSLAQRVHWFYNELTVPVGMDKLGSFFMADGFGEGYFGMQVNSATERRILFSVWSPFKTDDPSKIPDSAKVQLLTKGPTVQAAAFGNEGAGGQSFMRFAWEPGKTYGFLLHAQPDKATTSTTYTAYFKDVSANKWYVIASFKRPQTVTYLTHLYSFLENFIPEMGATTRMGFYKNQWIADEKTNWYPLTEAKFTIDATGRDGYREDFAGGVNEESFFLKNAGFFNNYTAPDQLFKKAASRIKPDLRSLP